MTENNEYKIINYGNRVFKCYKTGEVYRKKANNTFKQVGTIPHKASETHSYYRIRITINNHEQDVKIHRLLAFAFLNLDINNKQIVVDHIDGNGLNNNISNLRLCSSRENSRNMKNIKGVSLEKSTGKYRTSIMNNEGKRLHKCGKNYDDVLQWRKNKEIEFGYLTRCTGIQPDEPLQENIVREINEIEEIKTNIKKTQIEIKRMSNHQKQIFKLCNNMRKDIRQIQRICKIKRTFIEPSDSSDSDSESDSDYDSDSDSDSFIIY